METADFQIDINKSEQNTMTEMWKKNNTLMGKLHNIDEAFTFDDVTLIPQYSDIDSRSEIDISVAVCKGFKFSSPLIPANMSTVSGAEMLMYCYQQKSLGLLHRFMDFKEKKSLLSDLKLAHPDIFNYVGVSIGVKENDYQELKEYSEMGIRIVCIDVAHLDSKIGLKMVRHVASNYPKMLLIAGTVATNEGTYRAFEAGADIVRVGISGGCLAGDTRILMANGAYKNIKDVAIGDYVINKDGKPVKVINSFSTGIKNVLKIRNNSFYTDTFATPDHKFWSCDFNDVKKENLEYKKYAVKNNKNGQSRLSWKEAKELKQDAFFVPTNIKFNMPSTFSIDLKKRVGGSSRWGGEFKYQTDVILQPSYDLGYVFGTFLGDGHAFVNSNGKSKIGNVSWYFGINEKEIVEKLQSCLQKIFKKEVVQVNNDNNIIHMCLYYKPFADFLLSFGKKNGKKLPEHLLVNCKEYLQGIFDGLIDSDGHVKNETFELTNSSPFIIELFNVINLIINNYFPNNSKREPRVGGLKNCNIENCHETYTATTLKKPEWRTLNDNYIVKLLENEDIGLEMEVYDLTVDDDTHSFIANNMVVHNSICTTREETGNGVPQISAISKALLAKQQYIKNYGRQVFLISDGGVTKPSDFCKALCFTDMVIAGNIFAGTNEAPGQVVEVNGISYKHYDGSSTLKNDRIEGVKALVARKGPAKEVFTRMHQGLQSCCSYQNCRSVDQLQEKAVFARVSNAGAKEGNYHNVILREKI